MAPDAVIAIAAPIVRNHPLPSGSNRIGYQSNARWMSRQCPRRPVHDILRAGPRGLSDKMMNRVLNLHLAD